MTYPEFSANGTSGMEALFDYTKSVIPFYDGLLLGTIFLVLTFASYFIQEQKKGKGDFPVAFAVGSTITTILATILSLLSNFVSSITLGTFIALTIVSYIILFYSEP